MQLTLFRNNTPPSEGLGDHDIDVAPVMNMFIILVTFLVSMTVFTHIAMIDFSLPPNVSAGLDQSAGKPKVKLTVRVGQDFLGIVLGEKLLDSLPVAGGIFPFEQLGRKLRARRAETAIQDEIVIASLNAVAFKRVVRVMDICRESGFASVGLSSATENPEACK